MKSWTVLPPLSKEPLIAASPWDEGEEDEEEEGKGSGWKDYKVILEKKKAAYLEVNIQ